MRQEHGEAGQWPTSPTQGLTLTRGNIGTRNMPLTAIARVAKLAQQVPSAEGTRPGGGLGAV